MGYGLDPNMLVNALANKDNGGNNDAFGGNGLLWIFLLILFMGGGFGNGFGNRQGEVSGVEGQIEAAIAKANAAGCSDQLILTAINGNKEAIGQLSSYLGVEVNEVQRGISGLERGICDLGYKNGQDTASIIQNVTNGNNSLSRQLADCCCGIERNIDSIKVDLANSCCETNRNIDSVKNYIDKCCCETNRNIDSVRYDMATGFCAVNTNIDKCCCETNRNIDKSTSYLERVIDSKIDQQSLEMRAGFQGIRDYMTAEKVAALQNELQSAQFQISQVSQTQAIKDTVASYFGCPPGAFPCPCGQNSTK